MYTLTDLDNSTTCTLRIRATNANGDATNVEGDAIWSQEVTGSPRPGACLLDFRIGNPLANSVPVYATVKDAAPGTRVYLRYRTTTPGPWSQSQNEATQEGETTVTFDVTGLQPETDYEVEVSLDPGFSPTRSTVRAFFTSGVAPISGRTSGGSFARILRIEPAFTAITINAGGVARFSVDVYGRQDILDNMLAASTSVCVPLPAELVDNITANDSRT